MGTNCPKSFGPICPPGTPFFQPMKKPTFRYYSVLAATFGFSALRWILLSFFICMFMICDGGLPCGLARPLMCVYRQVIFSEILGGCSFDTKNEISVTIEVFGSGESIFTTFQTKKWPVSLETVTFQNGSLYVWSKIDICDFGLWIWLKGCFWLILGWGIHS